MPCHGSDAKSPIRIWRKGAEEITRERQNVEFILNANNANQTVRNQYGLRKIVTSRGPSQTAKWFPVGDRANDARDVVGRGKC